MWRLLAFACTGILGPVCAQAEPVDVPVIPSQVIEHNDGPIPYLELVEPGGWNATGDVWFFSEDIILYEGINEAEFESDKQNSYEFGGRKTREGKILDIVGIPRLQRIYAYDLAQRTAYLINKFQQSCYNYRTGDFSFRRIDPITHEYVGYYGNGRRLSDLTDPPQYTPEVKLQADPSLQFGGRTCRYWPRGSPPQDAPLRNQVNQLVNHDGWTIQGKPPAPFKILNQDGDVVLEIVKNFEITTPQLNYDGRYYVSDERMNPSNVRIWVDGKLMPYPVFWRQSNCAWLMFFTMDGHSSDECMPFVSEAKSFVVLKGGKMFYAYDRRSDPDLGDTGLYWLADGAGTAVQVLKGETPFARLMMVSPSGCKLAFSLKLPGPNEPKIGLLDPLRPSIDPFQQRMESLGPAKLFIFNVCGR